MAKKFINLTPHEVTIQNGSLKITITPSKEYETLRINNLIETSSIVYEVVEGVTVEIPVTTVTQEMLDNLPAPKEGIVYIVSNMIASIVKREDFMAPITDNTATRDDRGRVISVTGLQTFK